MANFIASYRKKLGKSPREEYYTDKPPYFDNMDGPYIKLDLDDYRVIGQLMSADRVGGDTEDQILYLYTIMDHKVYDNFSSGLRSKIDRRGKGTTAIEWPLMPKEKELREWYKLQKELEKIPPPPVPKEAAFARRISNLVRKTTMGV
jgi:hypothetical protein